MRTKHVLFSILGICVSMATLSSCNDNDDDYVYLRPTALVTVCPNADGSFIMQLDDNTKLIPTNLKTSPYGEKEVRALVNYTEAESTPADQNLRNVQVNWLDSIRTKLPVTSLGDQNDVKFGNDPIEIIHDWVTVAEDGYLTLRVRTLWGDPTRKHILNLLTDVNPSDPYEFEIRHDAQGDKNGNWGDALIAFNLNKLPRPNGDNVKLKLKWKSFSGEKSTEFELKMRPNQKAIDAQSIRYSGSLE